jgi:hypothetical protein
MLHLMPQPTLKYFLILKVEFYIYLSRTLVKRFIIQSSGYLVAMQIKQQL